MPYVSVQSAEFDIKAALERLEMAGAGAQVSFTGVVRQNEANDLIALEIEHYPSMTQKALEGIAETAMSRFKLIDAVIIHRVGRLELGADIMMVGASAQHRKAAFEGADYMMDYLKSRAPFWKKEHMTQGSAWVAARQEDEAELSRWDLNR